MSIEDHRTTLSDLLFYSHLAEDRQTQGGADVADVHDIAAPDLNELLDGAFSAVCESDLGRILDNYWEAEHRFHSLDWSVLTIEDHERLHLAVREISSCVKRIDWQFRACTKLPESTAVNPSIRAELVRSLTTPGPPQRLPVSADRVLRLSIERLRRQETDRQPLPDPPIANDLVTRRDIEKLSGYGATKIKGCAKEWGAPEIDHDGRKPDMFSYSVIRPILMEQMPEVPWPQRRPAQIGQLKSRAR